MSRPTRAVVDLNAFRHNYRHAKSLASPARAVAVIKANGYGHGAVALARSLSGEADAFGVACLEEAQELRESGIDDPIVLLEGVFEPSEYADVDRLRLSPVIHDVEQIDWLTHTQPGQPIECWLKVDTGMHRLGLDPAALERSYTRLASLPAVRSVVLMTHFSRADETEDPTTTLQIETFRELTEDIEAPQSLANSAAILAWPTAHADWVRPGIMLYGASPVSLEHPATRALQAVMRFESALIAIRELPAGAAIGYGGRYICPAPTRVGVVAAGYADGYPRHARDGTPVSVRGRPTQLIGRVSMDMMTVDLTQIPDAAIGDPVELWGSQIPANDVASASDTIAYQLFTGITRRVPIDFENEG